MSRNPRQRVKDLEFSLQVLTEILKDEDLLDDDRINSKSRELKRKALEQDLDDEGAETSSAEWEPKTASETIEYSDGSVDRNGSQHE